MIFGPPSVFKIQSLMFLPTYCFQMGFFYFGNLYRYTMTETELDFMLCDSLIEDSLDMVCSI